MTELKVNIGGQERRLRLGLQAHITGIAREVVNEFQPAFLRAAKSGREAEAEAVRLSMMAEIQRRCEAETGKGKASGKK